MTPYHCHVCHSTYLDQEAFVKHKKWCQGFTSRCREGCPDFQTDPPHDPAHE